ncbi:MAG: Chloride channel protein [Labilithrix sp.]|nr:Chloride channel protein [Labilithrix sp.]
MMESSTLRSASWREILRILVALLVVSIGAALFGMAFRAGVQFVYDALFGARDVLEVFARLSIAGTIALPAFGGLCAGLIARFAIRSGSPGVGDVMEAVAVGRTRLPLRATVWKALGSWVAITTGNSVGREGALIQFGGSFGATVASTARISGEPARALIAAGTAAGFAAAYNTPFAAVLFVVEIVTGFIMVDALALTLVATAISTTLVRASVGGGPIYGQRAFTTTTTRELVAYAALGVLAALVGQGFMGMLARGERSFERTRIGQPWRAAIGGAMVGAMALAVPEVTGNGYETLNHLLDAQYGVGLVAVIVVCKALATTASVSSGSPGGVFTPSLLIGGGLGLCWGHVVAGHVGAPGSEGGYALVGMAAMIAATTHAPLMASVLVFEVSGDYAVVLPLVLATGIATFVSRRFDVDSIYTAELRRRGIAWEVTFDGYRDVGDGAER